MSIANILILISVALIVILGMAILSSGTRKRTNQYLAAFEFSAIIWLVTNFFTNISQNNGSALFFSRSTLIGGALLPLFILLFAIEYTGTRVSKLFKYLLVSIPIFLLVAVPTRLNIYSAEAGGKNLKTGPVYLLVVVYIVVYSIMTLKLIWDKYKSSSDRIQRSQLKYILTGAVMTFIPAVILSAIMPVMGFGTSAEYGPLSVAVLAVFTAIAIIRYQFLNIRVIVARTLAYVFSIAVVVAIFSVLAFGIASYLLKIDLVRSEIVFFAVFSAVTALVFQPIKRYFDKVSNRVFYRDAYDGQELLNNVNSDLVGEIDLYKLLNNTADTIKKNIKAGFCNFYIDQKASIEFHAVGTDLKIFAKSEWEELAKHLEQDQSKIISELGENDEKTAKLLRELQIGAIVKMTSQDQEVGYLITGQKLSGNTYAGQDIQILEIIADEVAIAVQNNLRYEEIAHFNITLQKKVDDATAQLKRTNEKLVALDEAKDEFISMASHQLRTPLTSMKGYVSMVIDGDAGKISSQQKNLLGQAFLSSQRMVYLIADLLNVSRLKTGKFVIEAKPTYLPDVVESELSQLTETVKARGLEMVFDKPKEFPTLNLDETKTRQVIMNFADNAIYYTPKGGLITVKLTATEDSVEFTVTDTGIGVSKADQHHLFTKFYRGGNARKARPDGTGLGLFMAKKVIAAEGGALIFKTTEGKGSTFGFSFPRTKLEIVSGKEEVKAEAVSNK